MKAKIYLLVLDLKTFKLSLSKGDVSSGVVKSSVQMEQGEKESKFLSPDELREILFSFLNDGEAVVEIIITRQTDLETAPINKEMVYERFTFNEDVAKAYFKEKDLRKVI